MAEIYHDVHIKADSREIYNALSDPEHLINWWPLQCIGTARLGEVYSFYFGPEYDWLAKVVSIKENSHIEFEMVQTMPDWEETNFGFTINPDKENTCVLSFKHEGWKTNSHHFRVTSYCWALLLKGLKDYVEEGKIVPFKNRA